MAKFVFNQRCKICNEIKTRHITRGGKLEDAHTYTRRPTCGAEDCQRKWRLYKREARRIASLDNPPHITKALGIICPLDRGSAFYKFCF